MAAKTWLLPFRPAIDPNALCVVPGAQLWFYESGGTTLYPVYTDETLTVELTNPVTANAAGVWPAIYYDDTLLYRVVLKDGDGVTLDEVDPYLPSIADDLTPDLQAIVAQVSQYANAASFKVSIAYATYAALSAVVGTPGQSAAVFGDAGTHTDPVVGGTVSNTGIYGWSTSPAGWRRLADLGNVTLSGPETLTNKTMDALTLKGYKDTIHTITDAAAFEIDPANGAIQTILLGANRTPKGTNFASGAGITLFVDDGTARTLTWTDTTFGPTGVKWIGATAGGGTAPTLAATGFTIINLFKIGSQVYGQLVGYV